MGYMTNGLTFNTLREASIKRMPEFKNKKGEPAHAKPDGSDWSLGEWVCAITGELGEAANIIKKVKRGDISLEEARPEIAKELADVQIYLDILAKQCGVDLGKATIEKFNEVSERVGTNIRITHDGSDWYYLHVLPPQTSLPQLPKPVLYGITEVIE